MSTIGGVSALAAEVEEELQRRGKVDLWVQFGDGDYDMWLSTIRRYRRRYHYKHRTPCTQTKLFDVSICQRSAVVCAPYPRGCALALTATICHSRGGDQVTIQWCHWKQKVYWSESVGIPLGALLGAQVETC
eukprot:gene10138-biopygen3773